VVQGHLSRSLADFILGASTNGIVNVYDSQSHAIIQTIKTNNRLIHSRFSIDGDKILLTTSKSGYMWDLTRKWSVNAGYDSPTELVKYQEANLDAIHRVSGGKLTHTCLDDIVYCSLQ
jgi:hypothetical protein